MNAPAYFASHEVDARVQDGIVEVIGSQPDIATFAYGQLTLMGAEPYFADIARELREQASSLTPDYLAGAALGATVLRSISLGTNEAPLRLDSEDFRDQRQQDVTNNGIAVLTDQLEEVVVPPYAYMKRMVSQKQEYSYAYYATQALPGRLKKDLDMRAFVTGTTAILRVHERARRRAAGAYAAQTGLVL